MGFNVYLTGGTVRDLITGATHQDLDFTIEGNPSKMARELEKEAPKSSSRMRSFVTSRFFLPATTKEASPPLATITMSAPARARKSVGPPSWKICAGAIFLSTRSPSL